LGTIYTFEGTTMNEINGKLLFTVAGLPNERRTGQPGPGTFRIVRERGMIFLTFPCERGGLLGENNTFFQADDGREWPVQWAGMENGTVRYLLPDDFPKS
jgi:hypothetical protein